MSKYNGVLSDRFEFVCHFCKKTQRVARLRRENKIGFCLKCAERIKKFHNRAKVTQSENTAV